MLLEGKFITISVEDGTLVIVDGGNIIRFDKEATYKLREMLIADFLKYLIMEWLTEHAESIVPEEMFDDERIDYR